MTPQHPKTEAESCVLVIFGASGDLVSRKLIPSLFAMHRAGRLPEHLCVLGVSRTEMSDDEFRDSLKEKAKPKDAEAWEKFSRRVHYLAGSATEADLYPVLIQRICELGREHELLSEAQSRIAEQSRGSSPWVGMPNVLFYLSVSPSLVKPIVHQIGASGMVYEGKRWCAVDAQAVPWQRIIVEKPIGTDLASAQDLNRELGRVFEEEAIYRIDHYLGKELVQNLLVMRFANIMFEPLWNNQYVDHVQVTAAESVGVGKRAGNFYDKAGATRDMLQSHLLQVLALVAMEPPSDYSADAIRREKVKVLEAVRIMKPGDVAEHSVFGRYGASGKNDDDDGGLGYTDLEGVDPDRRTETFAAMRLHIDNWRWAGVPFYMRSGKKMARKLTEVHIQFKRPPANLFKHFEPFASGKELVNNRLIINIAPDEGIGFRFEAKVPGPKFAMGSVKADMDYCYVFNAQPMEAYGPLLLDAMRGDKTLFKHRDEVEGTWRIVEPVLHSELPKKLIEEYPAGSWGPPGADALLAADHRMWHNPEASDIR